MCVPFKHGTCMGHQQDPGPGVRDSGDFHLPPMAPDALRSRFSNVSTECRCTGVGRSCQHGGTPGATAGSYTLPTACRLRPHQGTVSSWQVSEQYSFVFSCRFYSQCALESTLYNNHLRLEWEAGCLLTAHQNSRFQVFSGQLCPVDQKWAIVF